MFQRVEHIGIAVSDIAASEKLYTLLLNAPPYKQEGIESEGVNTSFYQVGETKIELVESTRVGSPIANFLEKRGQGVHHIAFGVNDILSEVARLKGAGFIFLNEEPKPGADGKVVCFLHPKSTGGVLVELCADAPTLI